MNKNSKIFLAGHRGMVGSALYRKLLSLGYSNIIVKSSFELNLLRQEEVESFFKFEQPEFVIIAAAKVGGIKANNKLRGEFIYENLMIQNNIIHAAYLNRVQKLLFLGSSCIYPKNAPQPLKEEYLLTGILEETNEPYAVAKIAGIKLCENYYRQYACNFISIMPTNLFGPNDNYDLENSHVIPALMRKIHLAKAFELKSWDVINENLNINLNEKELILELEKFGIKQGSNGQIEINLWGTGEVYREFLHVDDFVQMALLLFEKVNAEQLFSTLSQTHINVGTGEDITIKDLALLMKNIIGFEGEFNWSTNELNGTKKKCLDVSLMKSLIDFNPMSLKEGIRLNYLNYCHE